MAKIFLLVVIVLGAIAEGKIYDKCEFGNHLMEKYPQYFNKTNINTWICIAKYESELNTEAVSPPNWDGSRDYGIFQINSAYWCGDGKECGITCNDLTNDSLDDDVECVQHILKQQGIKAWVTYNNRCNDPHAAYELSKDCDF